MENEAYMLQNFTEADLEEDEQEYIPLKEHKYVTVSKMAYLIGVAEKYFGVSGTIFKQEIYDQLKNNKSARIIRNLCRMRTAMEQKFGFLNREFQTNGRDILSMSEYIPQDAFLALSNDGVRLTQKRGTPPVQYIIEINQLISDRINNCKSVFPTWLNWEYVKDLFLMPDGFTVPGTAAAAKLYYENKNSYPFHIYINWPPSDHGNVLHNDMKFVSLLYELNGDIFTDRSKLMDASAYVKSNIYEYIDKSTKIVMIVDCENSDVYNLISMLRSLEWENYLEKISKIILIDDVHTNLGWSELENCTDIPVEHVMTERLKEEKSLVDGTVIARTYEEFYENQVDSFILLSSDSDYWTLIRMLKKARFLVMVEHTKCGPDLKNKLEENCIFYCYLDDFYSGEESEKMKNDMLLKTIAANLKSRRFNITELLDEALYNLRITMTPAEHRQFFTKHLRNIQLSVDEDGKVEIRLKEK